MAPTGPLNVLTVQGLSPPHMNHVGQQKLKGMQLAKQLRANTILFNQVKWLGVMHPASLYFRESLGYFLRKINSGDKFEHRFRLIFHLTVFLYHLLLDCSLEQEIKRQSFYHVIPSL